VVGPGMAAAGLGTVARAPWAVMVVGWVQPVQSVVTAGVAQGEGAGLQQGGIRVTTPHCAVLGCKLTSSSA
jgi:hypothetical protein